MNMKLTRRQQEIYDYLRDHDFDSPPTLDELCQALGLASRGSLHKHISALIDAGLVEPMEGKHRGIVLREETPADEDALPFLGYIAAGRLLVLRCRAVPARRVRGLDRRGLRIKVTAGLGALGLHNRAAPHLNRRRKKCRFQRPVKRSYLICR